MRIIIIGDVTINIENVIYLRRWVDDDKHEDNPSPTGRPGLTFYFVGGEQYSVSFDSERERNAVWDKFY